MVVQGILKGEGFLRVDFEAITIIAGYFSPNAPTEQFERFLELNKSEVLYRKHIKLCVLGDLNAKSIHWGSPVTAGRGRLLEEWMSELDLVVLNEGNTPTFQRGGYSSYIDVTLASQNAARWCKSWAVLDGETLNDHQHILFEIHDKRVTPVSKSENTRITIDKERFKKVLATVVEGEDFSLPTVQQFTEAVHKAQMNSKLKAGKAQEGIPYWWNTDIENKRADCVSLRRRLTRTRYKERNHPGSPILSELAAEYRRNLKELRRNIEQSKKTRWEDLRAELENDIWGDGYRIVTKRICKNIPWELPIERKRSIVRDLFPVCEDNLQPREKVSDPDPFSMEELMVACNKLRTGTAPE
nr:unnamed protein product [Callosobruchus analis]